MSLSRRQITVLAAAVLAALAVATYCFFGNPLDPFDNKRFSKESWQRASAAYDLDSLARMSRDLINKHLQAGMSEAQIIELLGQPNDIQRGNKRDRSKGVFSYRYYIGSWSLQRMDDAFVYIHFDSNGRVVDREIYGY